MNNKLLKIFVFIGFYLNVVASDNNKDVFDLIKVVKPVIEEVQIAQNSSSYLLQENLPKAQRLPSVQASVIDFDASLPFVSLLERRNFPYLRRGSMLLQDPRSLDYPEGYFCEPSDESLRRLIEDLNNYRDEADS